MNTRADFSLIALYDALDKERVSRGMTWAAVKREINAQFHDVAGHKPIATSTITGLRSRTMCEGDGVLQMLLWLRRTPESFVPGFEDAEHTRFQLRRLGTAEILRWDTRALYSALNTQRQARAMSWQDVVSEVGGVTPAALTGLAKGGRATLPQVMRVVAWLGQPAVAFTRASKW